ncbi:MAG: putative membrane protein [Candidatus Woesearchaeota archaeon]|jgi:uncharacterized membrane protein
MILRYEFIIFFKNFKNEKDLKVLMAGLDDYESSIEEENKAKNVAGLVMMIVAVCIFIASALIKEGVLGLELRTVRIILVVFGVIFFLGAMVVKTIQIPDYHSDF